MALFANEVPGSDDDLVIALAETLRLDKVDEQIHIPKRLVIALERQGGGVLVAARGEGQQGVVLIRQQGHFRLRVMLLDDFPVRSE